jgi:hypothetical protein
VDHSDAGLAWEILQRYEDPATPQFDAVLEAAGVPPVVARALRFWHRESVANVRQFAAEVLPVVFGAIEAGRLDAHEATRRAGSAFAADHEPRTPGRSAWETPAPAADEVITLPPESPENAGLLEQRRRTVAQRLRELG